MKKLKLWRLIRCVNCSDFIRGRCIIGKKMISSYFSFKVTNKFFTIYSLHWLMFAWCIANTLVCHSVLSAFPFDCWVASDSSLVFTSGPSELSERGLSLSMCLGVPSGVQGHGAFITSAGSPGAQSTHPSDLWLPLVVVLLLVSIERVELGKCAFGSSVDTTWLMS